jgi:hypothetical protein
MGENVPELESLKGIDNRAVFFPPLAACAQKARPAQATGFHEYMDARLQATVLGKT